MKNQSESRIPPIFHEMKNLSEFHDVDANSSHFLLSLRKFLRYKFSEKIVRGERVKNLRCVRGK